MNPREPSPAKLTDRFLAYLIDTAPFVAGYHATVSRASPGSGRSVFLAWLALYLAYQWGSNTAGASIGKRCFGIRVTSMDGSPLGPGRSLARSVGLLLSTPLLNLGYLWAFLNADSRTWHDLLSGAIVVEAEPKSRAEALATACLSFALVAAIFGWTAWSGLARPTPADAEAIERAREGLKILARIEEQYRSRHGAYTAELSELAAESGDVAQFKDGMLGLFDPRHILIHAERDRFYIKAFARDRKSTPVSIKGP
ncbi:MAG: RDD family protein [Elusimicrobia bacterium]|nr:RDD family protein [Elusimicrobiota bacterium]